MPSFILTAVIALIGVIVSTQGHWVAGLVSLLSAAVISPPVWRWLMDKSAAEGRFQSPIERGFAFAGFLLIGVGAAVVSFLPPEQNETSSTRLEAEAIGMCQSLVRAELPKSASIEFPLFPSIEDNGTGKYMIGSWVTLSGTPAGEQSQNWLCELQYIAGDAGQLEWQINAFEIY